jgi:hypothetical protein
MPDEASHPSDQDLLSASDGELSPKQSAAVRDHLAACWACRTRMQEMEGAMADFMRARSRSLDPQLPAADASRARLQARLSKLAGDSAGPGRRGYPVLFGVAAVIIALCALTLGHRGPPQESTDAPARRGPWSSPDPNLTPGASLPLTGADVCRASDSDRVRLIPASLARQVFEEYGISDPPPRAFEVDYLISPALGGADDIRNFWPQPYSITVWNARVKDALEDHLHDLVCAGKLSLTSAQRDISSDWISAYKKYFHTDRPLPGHLAYNKDQPWE